MNKRLLGENPDGVSALSTCHRHLLFSGWWNWGVSLHQRQWMWVLLFVLLFSANVTLSVTCASPIDSTELILRDAYPLPLRWENIEASPYWVAGPQPQYNRKTGMSLVHLDPGEDVVLKLPPREVLRVLNPEASFQADELEFWFSDGSGLYAQLSPQGSSDQRSLLLSPNRAETMLVRVRRPHQQRQGIAVALFLSRHEPLPTVMPYRTGIAFPQAPTIIRRTNEATGKPFWLLTPDTPQMLTARGPARLSLDTLLPYPLSEAQEMQTYAILVRVDDQPLRTLKFQTTSERHTRVFIDDRERAVGEQAVAYFEVPPGEHRLTFAPTAVLYVRLFQEDRDAYLFPSFNQPKLEGGAGTPTPEVETRIEEGVRLGRNNRLRDSGVLATAQLQALAEEHPSYPPLRQVAADARNFFTFYQDLLPVEKLSDSPQQLGWFLPHTLLAPLATRQELEVAAQHTRDIRQRLANAPFLTLPPTPEHALVYKVPPRSGPAQLRILVENASLVGIHEFTIQFDHHEPVRLFVLCGPELAISAYTPSYLEAGLHAFLWQRRRAMPTAPLPVAQALWLPQPLLQVGVLELPLPAAVNEVRVQKTRMDTTPLRVALQYTGTKPFRLSEMEYLGLGSQLKGTQDEMASLVAALQNEPLPDPDTQPARHTLGNSWVPLVRFLLTQRRTLVATVAPLPQAGSSTRTLLAEEEQRAIVQKTQKLEQAGQWVAALEGWAQLVYAGTGKYRHQGLFGRVHALQELGEVFLAEQQLRGIMLYGEDDDVRAAAQEHLQQFYTTTADSDALLALAAFHVLQSPNVTTFRHLLEVLMTSGEHELALMVGKALPVAERPLPLLLRAAYRLMWWHTFENLVEQLPSEEDRWHWQAYRAVAQGEYRYAQECLQHAGTKGRPLAEAIAAGQQIAANLGAQDSKMRAEAIFAWERWQASLPGPWLWQVDNTIVTDYLGAVRLYSIDRDLYAQFYTATPQRPMQVQVLGPVRLAVEARPLHPFGTTTPLDDWLSIRAPGQLYVVPITNNIPSFGLQVVEDAALVPGRSVTTEIALGPGLHTLTLAAARTRVALRVSTQQPELPLEVLPSLSHHTLTAVWRAAEHQTALGNEQSGVVRAWTTVRLLEPNRESEMLTFPPLRPLRVRETETSLANLDPVVAARLALRFGELTGRSAAILHERVSTTSQLTLEERVLADAGSRAGENQCGRMLEASVTVSPAFRDAVCLAEGKIEQLLRLPLESGDDAVLRRALLLLKLAEENPSQRQRAQVLGEAMFATHAHVAGLAEIYARLTRDSTWELIPSVQTSAGLHSIETAGWKPESPRLRTRRALVPPLALGEYVVFEQTRLGISLHNVIPTTVFVDLSVEDVEYLLPLPLTAVVQVDQQPERHIPLSYDVPPASVQLPIPSGTHTVRVWVAQSVVNQFLRVRVNEQRTEGSGRVRIDPTAVVMTQTRSYHVATHQQPVRFTIAGPQWVRIDEWRDELVHSHTQFVDEGWHTIDLKPEPAQPEALFRVFQRTLTEEPAASTLRPEKTEPNLVPFPAPDFRSPVRPDTVVLHDVYPLGSQGNGTWSLMTSFVRRRNFDEDNTSPDRVPMEQFIETRATHRLVHEEQGKSYSETQVLTRMREHGGPTLGLAERMRFDLNWQNRMPLILQMQGEGYLQWPGGGRPPSQGGLEWSGLFRWEVSQVRRLTPTLEHSPSALLFTRAMSLRRREQYRPGHVDQDIFTNYKAHHRAGLTLAESISYTPWLDSEWTNRFALTTNETLILDGPDHAQWTSTWKQLLRDTQGDVGYSLRTFFADADRKSTSFRHILAFDLLQDYWFPESRLAVGLNFRHDLVRNDNTFAVSLTWHLDQGRHYRDFRPDLIDFLSLRRWRAAERPTNRVSPIL